MVLAEQVKPTETPTNAPEDEPEDEPPSPLHDFDTETDTDEEETIENKDGVEVDMKIAKPCQGAQGYYTCQKTEANMSDFTMEEMRARVIGPKAVLRNHHCIECNKPLNWTKKNVHQECRQQENFAWCGPQNPPYICTQCNIHQKKAGINAMHVLCGICWYKWHDNIAQGETRKLPEPVLRKDAQD